MRLADVTNSSAITGRIRNKTCFGKHNITLVRIHTVTWWLKAEIVDRIKQPLLGNSTVNTCLEQQINMQQLRNCCWWCFLCSPCWGYIVKTNGKSQWVRVKLGPELRAVCLVKAITEQSLVKTVTDWDSVYYSDWEEDNRNWAAAVRISENNEQRGELECAPR
jgi:hypothetical protein